MKKMVLVLAVMLSSCATKNVSAHSGILDWDVPNSVEAESMTSQQTLQKIVELSNQNCGANEAFDLMDKSKFDQEFEKMMVKKGYRKVPIIPEDGLYGLAGPKQLAAIFTDSKFTVCELTN